MSPAFRALVDRSSIPAGSTVVLTIHTLKAFAAFLGALAAETVPAPRSTLVAGAGPARLDQVHRQAHVARRQQKRAHKNAGGRGQRHHGLA